MKVNTSLLKGKIVEHKKNQEVIADLVGMDRSTFYRKMKSDGLTFTIGEMHKIVKAVPLTNAEAIHIFLGG